MWIDITLDPLTFILSPVVGGEGRGRVRVVERAVEAVTSPDSPLPKVWGEG